MSGGAGAALVDVAHDSESSTGGSGSGVSLPEDAVLNPVKPSRPGDILLSIDIQVNGIYYVT